MYSVSIAASPATTATGRTIAAQLRSTGSSGSVEAGKAEFFDPREPPEQLAERRREYAPRLTDTEIRVRRCETHDAPEVLALWKGARSEHSSTEDRIEDVERLLAGSPAALLVAELGGGEIVGALIAGWDGWRGNMYRLAVRDDCRRKGIGITLVRAGEEYLRGCGVTRITALVAFDDVDAGAFWETAGYPRDHEIGRRVRNV